MINQIKKNKLMIKTKHLSMYQTQKGFYYCQRRSINSVAVLCYKKDNNAYYFLLRYQPMPEIISKKKWNDLYPCPITGSIENNESPLISAVREVYEEGGILIKESEMIQINQSVATTQMNEQIHYFLVDVSSCKQLQPNNDGTLFEAVSQNIWVPENELIKIIDNNLHLASLTICYYHFLLKIVKKI